MQGNDHQRDRQGQWSTEGLKGAALALVQGDQKDGSWLGKMKHVKQLLVDDAPNKRPQLDALANAYIYLQWINTGAIPCVEGGGHFRPNHHAEQAAVIFRSLEWVIGDPNSEREALLVARKLQTKLPSFTDKFQAKEPLTRIRDIAHRNDIPHDIKKEIKHTIQNKLHRNAGPEDLVATEAMLQRITAPGTDYSQAFVQEFKVFTQELRDFFNASSFADMLAGIKPALDDPDAQVLDRFAGAKARLDSSSASMNDVMEALHQLTTVRAVLGAKLSSGLRNDAPDNALAMRQRFRLAEIRAEDYAFVLLSQMQNIIDGQGGAEGLAGATDAGWAQPIGAAVLGIRHMGMSGWEPAECTAVENELTAWQQAGNFASKEHALRLKASLERVQRMTHAYTELLLGVFPECVNALGRGLGIQQERIQVFTESEVRASVVFQLSKLCSLLLKATRLTTGGGAWDALVAGTATGTLHQVDRIQPGALEGAAPDEDVVLLVKEASGDEEVGATGLRLRGVILAHSLPHLSHLGVRARQEKVVFVCCEDEDTLREEVHPLLGKPVQLSASLEGVTCGPANAQTGNAPSAGGTSKAAAADSPNATLEPCEKAKKPKLLKLAEAKASTSGAKAAACAELARLAEASGRKFSAPAGVVLPFGTMDAALQAAGKAEDFEALLSEVETAQLEGSALNKACNQLQELVSQLRPAAGLLKDAGKALGGKTVIVRSSANVEDIAGMSGAGLYDSIPNIPAGDTKALGTAVAQVWASLFTRRAVLSRRAAGVSQADASMAVLVQEQVAPQVSFVLHTASALGGDSGTLTAEVAAGLGETLASGTRGSPWRFSVDKQTGKVDVLAFANFSRALQGTTGKSGADSTVIDYSRQALSQSEHARSQLGVRLCEAGKLLEKEFGCPQDVEGALDSEQLFIVQTRPQPL